MGEFRGKRWRPYLDEEARKIRDEKLDHLQRNYDGPTDFLKQKLKEEKALDLEERIQKIESEINNKESDLEKLQRIKNEREQQDKLRDKKELLKEKQKKLKKAQNKINLSKEEAENKALAELRDHSRFEDKAEEELRKTKAFKKKVDSLTAVDVDELVEDVQRLQSQVADLNSGREDWFMDLDQDKLEQVQA